MIKKIILFTFTILFWNCNSTKNMNTEKKNTKNNFINVTDFIEILEFKKIKEFILEKGDKMTYRNFDNNNPHYQFENFDVFLGSEIGQKNINNNPEISDFNQLTIFDANSNVRYYELILVKKGDLKKEKYWIKKGMKEEQVYLVDSYNKGLNLMKGNLSNYLKKIRKEIKNKK